MKFTVDRSQAEVKSFATPGEYTVVVASAKDEGLDKYGNQVVTLRYKASTGETIGDRFTLKETLMWRVQSLISATEANIDDGKEFDFSIPGAFLGFLQGFTGLALNIIVEEEKYTDKEGAEKTTLRVKRLKKTPADEAF
jgi:hypothetical protein